MTIYQCNKAAMLKVIVSALFMTVYPCNLSLHIIALFSVNSVSYIYLLQVSWHELYSKLL